MEGEREREREREMGRDEDVLLVLRSTGLPAASSESTPSAAERQQTFGGVRKRNCSYADSTASSMHDHHLKQPQPAQFTPHV